MNSFKGLLKSNFNYSDEMISFIERLIPCLIEYYGAEYERRIYTAFLKCCIHFQEPNESPDDFLKSYFGNSVSFEEKSDGVRAFFHNELFLKDKLRFVAAPRPLIYVFTNINGKYVPFDFNDPDCINILIHEICHLIKGIGNVRTEGDRFVDSTGLFKSYYVYSFNFGFVELNNEAFGIEEAFNECDAVAIQKILTGIDYQINGYVTAGNYAMVINEEFPRLASKIRKAQMDYSVNWHEDLDKNTYEDLISAFDVLVKEICLHDNNYKFTDEQLKKIEEAQKVLDNFIIDYNDNVKKSKFRLILSKKKQNNKIF